MSASPPVPFRVRTAAVRPRRGRALACACAAAVCASTLAACASTLQSDPIPHNILEGLVTAQFPVYWLGSSFQRLPVSEAIHDPSGAYSVQYGSCLEGGDGNCVPQLRIVTSPDNSFLPAGLTAVRHVRIRGVPALLALGGRTVIIPTGPVVIDVYATSARTALAAARTAVPIDQPGEPEAPLPAVAPDSGFNETPLHPQVPSPLHPLPEVPRP
jgi:hypothetical protein